MDSARLTHPLPQCSSVGGGPNLAAGRRPQHAEKARDSVCHGENVRERASLPAELHGIASWNGLVASSASCCMEWSCRENAKNH